MNEKALLIIDVQNDFCPGGALAVSNGDRVIPVLNNYMKFFLRNGLPILASRDWHPRKTAHFKDEGGPWPVHCVRESFGAMFHFDLELPAKTIVISKGTEYDAESYSAFLGHDKEGRGLSEILKKLGVKDVHIGGLATDYCVKASALDALKNGFNTWVLTDAIKGVDLKPGDSDTALKDMLAAGARPITFEQLGK